MMSLVTSGHGVQCIIIIIIIALQCGNGLWKGGMNIEISKWEGTEGQPELTGSLKLYYYNSYVTEQ